MDDSPPLISIVTPCFNEEGNAEEVYAQVRELFRTALPGYRYEHIFIDNASKDRTPEILRRLAAEDPNVKVILNVRNFGHIRSPYHAFLQAEGDAAVFLAGDLQDPPGLVAEFVRKWEEGYPVVMAVKTESAETPLMFLLRKLYYDFIARVSDVRLVKNSTGFGLYDRRVIDILRKVDDPYPYFRGLVAELGFEPALVEYFQPARRRGVTKNNFYTLYDIAMLGVTSHSKVPLRLATMLGFASSAASLAIALTYFVLKLLRWETFQLGLAPLIIGLFFFGSVQLFFIGIIGEYVGFIYTQILKRPMVVEKERLNFDGRATALSEERYGAAIAGRPGGRTGKGQGIPGEPGKPAP